MMEGIGQYLRAVSAAALLSAVLLAIVPKGPVRRVTGFACALMLLMAVVGPVNRLNVGDLVGVFEDYWDQLSVYPEELEETDAALTESIIVSQSEAYIEDKAAECGIHCEAVVTCRSEGGIAVPEAVKVTGALTATKEEQLRAVIEEGFGLVGDAVTFQEG